MTELFVASRAAWEAHNRRPAGDFLVCHRCDNPPCCNPEHLFLGTDADNMADMRLKGRSVAPPVKFGTENNKTRLSPEVVAIIRASPGGYGTGAALARRFGVARNTIYRIQQGRARVNG